MRAPQPLLLICLLCCAGFVLPGMLIPETVFQLSGVATAWVLQVFGRFYLWLGFLLVIFCIGLAISPWGKLRLGAAEEKPRYSRWSWVAMLYSAGMGAGLLLRAVQEPVYYYLHPPVTEGLDQSNELLALQYAYFHWGFTAWAFYAAFGLIAAYFQFRKGESAQAGVALHGLIGRGNWFIPIDALAVMATIFGLVAAVGLGAGQIAGGLGFLMGVRLSVANTVLIALLVGGIAFISAWTGLERGIKWISTINLGGAILLLLFFFLQNDFASLLYNAGWSFYYYLRDFVYMSLALGSYGKNPAFLADWTIFYWAFWLAWAPFTGLFIARISRGRSIRSFVAGVLVVPSAGTFLWFAVFGTRAFDLVNSMPAGYQDEFADIFTALFRFYEFFPAKQILSVLTVFLLGTFLVTSLDSAIYVISMMTDNGEQNPSKRHKLIWGITLPLVTATAILVGGDTLLQSMSNLLIVTALPFGILLAIMIFAFFRILLAEKKQ